MLGLVEFAEPVTPYDLKQFAAMSVQHFWSLPHTQIYTQCDRLTEAGLLSEKREPGGRRRRLFSTTAAGRAALDEWRAETGDTYLELRDTGLLKLFFGADPRALGEEQAVAHSQLLAEYEEIAKLQDAMTGGMRKALQAGIKYEREMVKFWRDLAKNG